MLLCNMENNLTCQVRSSFEKKVTLYATQLKVA